MDDEHNLFGIVYDTVKYIFVGAIGLMVFWFKRLTNQVDVLKEETVKEDVFNSSLEQIRQSIDRGFGEIREDIKGVHYRIDRIMEKKWSDKNE